MKKIALVFMFFIMCVFFTACSNTAVKNPQSSVPVASIEQLSSSSAQKPEGSSEKVSESASSEKTEGLSEQVSGEVQTEKLESSSDTVKSLVVYFSCTGNTKAVAEKIAEYTHSDLYQIVPKVPYTDEDLNYNNKDCRANKEMEDTYARPEIESEVINISDYDTIFIGYPIWWGTMPRIINTFLDTYDLSGKVIMPFCTSGGSGISRSEQDITDLEPNADIRTGLRVSGVSDSSINEWLTKNNCME